MNAAVQVIPTRKIWDTPGGVHPPDNKAQSLQHPLEALLPPPIVVLPLNQHIGAPAETIVAVGDKVLKGQLVAAAKGNVSANVHASISGEIIAIEARPIAHPSGMEDTCIVIANDSLDQWCELQPCPDYRQQHPAEIINRIQAAGVVGMGGAGFPTAVKLQPNKSISTLIINATECEPYITADDSLLQHYARDVVAAIELLDYLLEQPAEILIAIEDNKPDAIGIMQQAIKNQDNKRIDVAVLPTKYPSGGEKQLIQMLTGKEVGQGQLPANLGIVCQNVATIVAAYRAVVKGEPLIDRITTVSGAALGKPQNVIVPLGTPIEFLLDQQDLQKSHLSRLVMGGPMMGFTLTDTRVPVVKTTNCILALSVEESPPPLPAQACIRCGMCAEACPASLLPQQLYWYARAQDHDKLQAYHLSDCIECGACSYACPSSIPLVQYYRAAKAEIRHAAFEKQQSDRARQRFEFHKQRIEAEKQARAEAKKIAAEKAKQRSKEKAEKNEAITDTGNPTSNDNEKAKIERNLASTLDRLNKLKQKLEDANTNAPEQAQAIQAQIKNTELKYQTLRDKLSNLIPSDSTQTFFKTSKEQSTPELTPEDIESKPEEPVLDPIITSKQQADQWRQQLAENQEKLAKIDPIDTDTFSALKMAVQILENKIASVEVDSSLRGVEKISSKGADDDAVLRAMENALAKKFEQPSDNNPSNKDD